MDKVLVRVAPSVVRLVHAGALLVSVALLQRVVLELYCPALIASMVLLSCGLGLLALDHFTSFLPHKLGPVFGNQGHPDVLLTVAPTAALRGLRLTCLLGTFGATSLGLGLATDVVGNLLGTQLALRWMEGGTALAKRKVPATALAVAAALLAWLGRASMTHPYYGLLMSWGLVATSALDAAWTALRSTDPSQLLDGPPAGGGGGILGTLGGTSGTSSGAGTSWSSLLVPSAGTMEMVRIWVRAQTDILPLNHAVYVSLLPVVPLSALGMAAGELEVLESAHAPVAFGELLIAVAVAVVAGSEVYLDITSPGTTSALGTSGGGGVRMYMQRATMGCVLGVALVLCLISHPAPNGFFATVAGLMATVAATLALNYRVLP